MDGAIFDTEIAPQIEECRQLLNGLAQKLGDRNYVVLMETEGMFDGLVAAFHRVIRRLQRDKPLDLILDSGGGSIDAASSIASLCQGRFGSFRAIVPFMAKSAATLLVLAADQRILACSAQLGPVDPQVRHPENPRMWFPAHSIKEALERVEATPDPIVKMAMADKLDPFLIGAFQDSISASKQYIEEIVQGWGVDNTDVIVSTFVDKYRSHGYPIDLKVVKELKIPCDSVNEAAEDLICDLHEKCTDILDDMDADEGSIIMTADRFCFRADDFKMVSDFHPKPSTRPSKAKTPKPAAPSVSTPSSG